MKNGLRGGIISMRKKHETRGRGAALAAFDERFVEDNPAHQIRVERRFNAAIKDAQALIEIYCKSEGLKMDEVDFEILIDGRDDKYWLTAKVGTACDAMGLVSSLLKRGYAKYHLTVRDNSAGKTILIMDQFEEKDWRVGMDGTREEIDEWDKRNRNYEFLSSDNKYLHERDEYCFLTRNGPDKDVGE
jgi:hypothetical protein